MSKVTNSLIATLLMAGAVQAETVLLAGWHSFSANEADTTPVPCIDDATADVAANGISGLLGGQVNPEYDSTGGGVAIMDYGSQDGTFGTAFGGAAVADAAGWGRGNSRINVNAGSNSKRRIDFMITNQTGFEVKLNGIHWDQICPKGHSNATTYQLMHWGKLEVDDLGSENTVLGTYPLETEWVSMDLDLAGKLPDLTLADGESAAFWIKVTDGSDANAIGFDNIAVSGTLVPGPEPIGLISALGEGVQVPLHIVSM